MILFKKTSDITEYIAKLKGFTCSLGFVPTMGALHAGHVSLLKESKKNDDITVCSIFINPTQFNNADDLKRYPVTIENDIYLLEKNGCDILFMPDVSEIYPQRMQPTKHFELGYLETILEGKYRPGHFQGVCQVVERLLQIVQPNKLFLGQKDYQQCMVIKKLLELMKANITLVVCSTLRERDGLAMSSRNLLLNENERKQAPEVFKTLSIIKEKIKQGSLVEIKEQATQHLINNGFNPDYVEIATADDLKIVNEWDGRSPVIALAAAFINKVRLIDNLVLTE